MNDFKQAVMKAFLTTRKQIALTLGISPITLKKYVSPFYDQVPFFFEKKGQLTPVEYEKLKGVLVNELGYSPDEFN